MSQRRHEYPKAGGRGLDIHELLKREVAVGARTGVPEDVYGVSDQYIVLDSFLKRQSSATDRGEFSWNFMVQGVTDNEVIGVKDIIDSVIEIQIGAFAMPMLNEVPYNTQPAPAPVDILAESDKLFLKHNNSSAGAGAPTLVPNDVAGWGQYPPESLIPTIATPMPTTQTPWIHNPYTQVPFFGRCTVQIREAGLQSYSDRNGARHHYELSLSAAGAGANPNMLLAAPQGRWDTFIFTEPLNDIHGLTLVFRNPDIPIRFMPDCLYNVTIGKEGSSPAEYLKITAPGHGLCMGDRFMISGFKSENDRLDNYMNRPEGHVAGGNPNSTAPTPLPGELITGDGFWTDPAVGVSGLLATLPKLPQFVTICIAKRRMRIPIRIRRIVPRLTNYISPN